MQKITHISDKYLGLIEKWEGLKLSPYKCPAGIWTIGLGSTYYEDGKKVASTDKPITKERAFEIFKHAAATMEKQVDASTVDTINQNQFDALFDFVYNAGYGSLKSSSFLKKVNINPNDPTIRENIMMWVFGGDGSRNGVDDDGDGKIDEAGEKQKLKGLVNRCTNRANLYFGLI